MLIRQAIIIGIGCSFAPAALDVELAIQRVTHARCCAHQIASTHRSCTFLAGLVQQSALLAVFTLFSYLHTVDYLTCYLSKAIIGYLLVSSVRIVKACCPPLFKCRLLAYVRESFASSSQLWMRLLHALCIACRHQMQTGYQHLVAACFRAPCEIALRQHQIVQLPCPVSATARCQIQMHLCVMR
jgi:hypothetical protein